MMTREQNEYFRKLIIKLKVKTLDELMIEKYGLPESDDKYNESEIQKTMSDEL